MRHGKRFNHLGRTKPHREAMLANMASSLVKHKKINTTVAKAKALRGFIEPLITKAKSDTTHSRRTVFKELKDKYAVTELFRDIAPKVADRPGGYTRILKTGRRLGDNAEMCFIELVDFNEIRTSEQVAAPETKKRTRRGKKKSESDATPTAQATTNKDEDIVKDAEIIEEVIDEKEEVKADATPEVEEATKEEATEEEKPETETAEEPVAEAKEEAESAEETTEEEPADVSDDLSAEATAKEETSDEAQAEAKSNEEDSTDETATEEDDKKKDE